MVKRKARVPKTVHGEILVSPHGHRFTPGKARGYMYELWKSGMDDDEIIRKAVAKFGFTKTHAKGKLAVIKTF